MTAIEQIAGAIGREYGVSPEYLLASNDLSHSAVTVPVRVFRDAVYHIAPGRSRRQNALLLGLTPNTMVYNRAWLERRMTGPDRERWVRALRRSELALLPEPTSDGALLFGALCTARPGGTHDLDAAAQALGCTRLAAAQALATGLRKLRVGLSRLPEISDGAVKRDIVRCMYRLMTIRALAIRLNAIAEAADVPFHQVAETFISHNRRNHETT